MMKSLIILVALLIISGAVSAQVLVDISVDSIDPQPAEPGRNVTLNMNFINQGSLSTNPKIVVNAIYPLILQSSLYDLETRFQLCASCKTTNTYFINVASRASSGIYPIVFRAISTNAEVEKTVYIEVKGTPNLLVTTDTDLDKLIPGSTYKVVFDIKNIGTGTAREITSHINSDKFIAIGNSIRSVDQIMPQEVKTIVFDISLDNSLEAGSYNIPLLISYKDDSGEKIDITQNIGAKVINEGSLNIQSIKIVSLAGSSAITTNNPFTVIVRLENVGTGNAEFTAAELKCPFDTTKKTFLGKLEKDEDAPAVFDLVSKQSGNSVCTLTVNFKDDVGEKSFTEKIDINITESPSSTPLIIIAAILIIGFIFRNKIRAILKK